MKFLSKALALTALCASVAQAFKNPLKPEMGADPDIVVFEGQYYLTSTTFDNIQITRAPTLEGLKTGERKTVWTDLDPSRSKNMWAPEMHLLDGKWHIYYTAGNGDDPAIVQRSHVLRGGASPFDNYEYAGQMVPEWAIDGTVMFFGDTRYYVWSCQIDDGQSLCIATLDTPTSIGPTFILSQPTEDWERRGPFPVNEGPHALYQNGKTWLTYSASFCGEPSYSLGLLEYIEGDPLQASSWRKSGPVLTQANGNFGTGHNGFFPSVSGGEVWMVYHATGNPQGDCGVNRYTMAQRVNFREDGSPDFGVPQPLDAEIPNPSGD